MIKLEIHVKEIPERLRAASLQARVKKRGLHVTKTKLLGFVLTIDGIEVDSGKTAVIRNWDVPTIFMGVQSLMCFTIFTDNLSQITIESLSH